MGLIIYYLFLPIVFLLALVIIGLLFYKYVIVYNTSHRRWFKNREVQDFCYYARKGDIKKIDQLLERGVDVNVKGKDNITPLIWLMTYSFATKKALLGFKYLLKKGAGPLNIFEKTVGYNAFQLACMLKNPNYLKILLETYKPTKEELNAHEEHIAGSAIEEAIYYDRMAQFKMLIDYGIDINWKDWHGQNILNKKGHYWNYAYYLLKAGADWQNISKAHRESESVKPEDREKPDFICDIEKEKHPSLIVAKYKGVDYFQKIVSFLKKEGADFSLNLDPKEEYRTINGKDILFINENGNWIEYKKSKKYKKDLKMFKPTIMERIGEFIGIM